MALTRWNKVWVVVTLCSLLAYDLRWLYGVFDSVLHILGFAEPIFRVSWQRFWVDYVLTGLVGDVIRLLGVLLALLSVYLVWGPKPKPFSSVKKKVALALLFEGIYWLTLMPITVIEFVLGVAPLLMIALILQILLVSPVLIVLSRTVWLHTESATTNVIKWSSVAAIAYLAGIWISNVFRWLNMSESTGIGFLLSGITSLGFLNSVVTLSLSVVFAVAGFYTLLRKENRRRSTKLFALALIMLGLHFAVFILYSAIANALSSVLLVEIWPVTLLGLGLSMLRGET